MKVLNICRLLPIRGLPAENDITFKIYADLKTKYQIDSMFVMPVVYIPKWAARIKKTLRHNYNVFINKNYKDEKHSIGVYFFRSVFPIRILSGHFILSYYNLVLQFAFYKRDIYQMFKKFQPDLIHAHTISDAFYAYKLYKKFKTPYILTLRGKYSKIYKKRLVNKILKNACYLITPSYDMYKNISKNYKVELLPHGLDKEWYTVENRNSSKGKLRFVTVSRLLDWKNIELILKSLAQLKMEGVSFSYAHIGDGPLKASLLHMAEELDIKEEVTFHGLKSPDEIRAIYKENDIFILLSYPETFGRVYYEAAAQGLLVIGRKGTGADGHFTEDEAIFVEPTVERTVSAIKKITPENLITMTIKSKRKMDSFKNNLVIDRYYKILENKVS